LEGGKVVTLANFKTEYWKGSSYKIFEKNLANFIGKINDLIIYSDGETEVISVADILDVMSRSKNLKVREIMIEYYNQIQQPVNDVAITEIEEVFMAYPKTANLIMNNAVHISTEELQEIFKKYNIRED
jgi:ABC-type uncharacterized transport system substrate-binding protein